MSCPCGPNMLCVPVRGQLRCHCKQGFLRGDGGSCIADGSESLLIPLIFIAGLILALATLGIILHWWNMRSYRRRRLQVEFEIRAFDMSSSTRK